MSQSSPRVSLPYLQPSQAQKHVTHNEALLRLDAVTQLTVQGFSETSPPGLPLAGDIYGVGAGATGSWAGQDGLLAYWDGTGWVFVPPQEGWRAWGLADQELRVWQPLLDGVAMLGINSAADGVNRLSVAAPASLFSHDGAGHQMKINKATDSDTASLLFQSNWTGHAEMGLAGDAAFSLKISADGTTWDQVLRADPATLEITFAPAGADRMVLGAAELLLDVPVTGTAVQAGTTDATAGRLMTVGAFGLGETGYVSNLGDWNATDKPGGLYLFSINTSNLSAKPDDYYDGNYGLVRIDRYSANFFIQTCWRVSGDTKPYMRRYQNGTWSAWERLFIGTNILGAVSQSGGIPTGAMIERGSNANGEYVRYADGTQICWGTSAAMASTTAEGNLYTSPADSWAFPASFNVAPNVSGTVPSGSTLWVTTGGTTSTAVTIFIKSSVSAASIKSAVLTAIGRWF